MDATVQWSDTTNRNRIPTSNPCMDATVQWSDTTKFCSAICVRRRMVSIFCRDFSNAGYKDKESLVCTIQTIASVSERSRIGFWPFDLLIANAANPSTIGWVLSAHRPWPRQAPERVEKKAPRKPIAVQCCKTIRPSTCFVKLIRT